MKGSPYGVLATAKRMEDRTFSSAASATIVIATINAIKEKVFSSNGEIGLQILFLTNSAAFTLIFYHYPSIY
jgi:hypothetical protein